MIRIREGVKGDLPRVLELVKELAEYEKALPQVTNTVELMEKEGFGADKVFGFFVAEEAGVILGISVFYYRYSTWKGRRLYLEDIVVTQSERGRGIGNLLFERTMRYSLEQNCSGMMWQVLEWNEPAINFYKKYNATLDAEWINCNLEADQINDILTKPKN
jgi:GNAT superfamily N-acetyltransferase